MKKPYQIDAQRAVKQFEADQTYPRCLSFLAACRIAPTRCASAGSQLPKVKVTPHCSINRVWPAQRIVQYKMILNAHLFPR
jgi:hypothetical protein